MSTRSFSKGANRPVSGRRRKNTKLTSKLAAKLRKKARAATTKASKLLASQKQYEASLLIEEQIAIARRRKLEYIYGKNVPNDDL